MKMMRANQFNLDRQVEYGTPEQNETVQSILAAVRERGDEALRELTERFDRVKVEQFRVPAETVQAAYEAVDEEFLAALRLAAANIRTFHEKQKRTSWFDTAEDGTILGQMLKPLARVGLYVPGGKAAYPSSVLMNAIPAQVAGVREIAMVTPASTAGQAGINPYILVAAAEAGVTEIYGVGGAQAVAALAYGTESIKPVDKIVGPGNIYVALAKRYVYGVVDIDSIAGPSEIVVLADGSADPAYVAADLLSQAEHDEMASSILVTTDELFGRAVAAEVDRQLETLPRRDIASRSLDDRGAILLVDSLEEGIEVVNRLAPEHLEVLVPNPFDWLGRINTSGAVFLGPYSSEPVGDYIAGPNHILPTNGTARFSSPLNVDDFLKKTSVISYSKQALLRDGAAIMTLARHEGLEGHARAIEVRLQNEGEKA